jgi:lysophospholipase L1-like esterase
LVAATIGENSFREKEEQMASNRGFPVSQLAIKLRAATLAIVMAGAATLASAAPPAALGNSSSLALGDSVVFGYIAADGYAYVNPSNFVGYPEYVGRDLRLDTANAACPGETSSSFISSTGADFGCRGFRANFPLHVSYTSTQLGFATNFLATHKQTRLVTISLGANDGLLLEESCNGDPACIQAGLPQAVATLTSNMNTILRTLRATGFRGVLMVVNYYSVDYTDPGQTGLTVLLNQTLAAVAFTAFRSAASTVFAGGKTCKAGLLNVNPLDATQMSCDDHPSQSGQQLLADTVEARYQAARPGS